MHLNYLNTVYRTFYCNEDFRGFENLTTYKKKKKNPVSDLKSITRMISVINGINLYYSKLLNNYNKSPEVHALKTIEICAWNY